VGDRHFEITTLRVDVETFGRHARVAYTDDWVEDAARRDLTINALSCSVDGTLHDPFGGLQDLALGRIRFVGEPAARIAEDRLRLLRYFRFYAHYGKAPPDETALAACAAAATGLADLSGERVAGEMLRLLAAPDPAPTLRLMAERGVLAHALPARADIPRLAALVAVEQTALGADALRRLGALQANGAEGAERIADRLKLSNAERERLLRLAGVPADLTPDLDGPARRRLLYRLGSDAFRDAVALAWAEAVRNGKATPTAEDWRALLRDAESWSQPKLPVKGRDLVALGVAPGPEVGRLLAEIEVWWVAGGFRADRAACLAYARSLFKAT
jgi:poly(A) polymerase